MDDIRALFMFIKSRLTDGEQLRLASMILAGQTEEVSTDDTIVVVPKNKKTAPLITSKDSVSNPTISHSEQREVKKQQSGFSVDVDQFKDGLPIDGDIQRSASNHIDDVFDGFPISSDNDLMGDHIQDRNVQQKDLSQQQFTSFTGEPISYGFLMRKIKVNKAKTEVGLKRTIAHLCESYGGLNTEHIEYIINKLVQDKVIEKVDGNLNWIN